MKFLIIICLLCINCEQLSNKLPNTFSSCIQKTCIEGHIYYINNCINQGGIAPKLNDDGKPCKCE